MKLYFYQPDTENRVTRYLDYGRQPVEDMFNTYVRYDYHIIAGLEVEDDNGEILFSVMREPNSNVWPCDMNFQELIRPKLPSIRERSLIEI